MGKQSGAPAVQYQNIDPTTVQNNAIQGDISSLTNANQLATTSGMSTAQQALAERNVTQPGYGALAGALTTDATNLANNPYQVPESVVNQLSQYAAQNNIGEGTGAGSGFSQSGLLQSLGINALQYGTQNLQSATQALSALSGSAPNVSPVSPLSFLLTPAQALGTATTNATNNQQINQGAANSATAANNANSSNLFDSLTGAVGQSGLTSGIQALLSSQNKSGVGAQTSYASFLANNPNSTAAVGTQPGGPGGAASCWVARAVFGDHDPRWRRWRKWFFTNAPTWVLRIYMRYGRTWARFIIRHPILKTVLAAWMNRCISTIKWREGCVATPA